MKKQAVIRIILWIVVIACMAAIFMFSAQDATESTDTSNYFIKFIFGRFSFFKQMSAAARAEFAQSITNIVRKCAHFSIYAFLGFWVQLLLRLYPRRRFIPWTALFCMLYAVTDEIHQYFVPGRSCRVTDVCIDTLGAVTGAIFSSIIVFIWSKLKNKATAQS